MNAAGMEAQRLAVACEAFRRLALRQIERELRVPSRPWRTGKALRAAIRARDRAERKHGRERLCAFGLCARKACSRGLCRDHAQRAARLLRRAPIIQLQEGSN